MEIKNNLISIDTETNSLEDKTLIGFSVAWRNKKNEILSNYYPLKHTNKDISNDNIQIRTEWLKELIIYNKVIFHNASFDIPVLVQAGIPFEVFNDIEDTVIMANLYDENVRHGLKSLVKRYFHHQMTELKEIIGTGKKQIPVSEADERILKYASEDAYYTYKLYEYLKEKLQQEKAQWKIYTEIEKPLLLAVAHMHIHGISIDINKLKEVSQKYKEQVELAESKLKILLGNRELNLNSSKQLRKYFIDELHMPVIKVSTKTKQPSVDKDVLEIYAEHNPVAQAILDYRKYYKIYSTFIPALTPTKIDIEKSKGKIYPSFNQAGTTSGRFSSSHPNLQNIPQDDDFGIRQCIVADEGEILIGADYSQIELRVLAHCSQDFNLMKAYIEDKDIHQQTADACGIERYPAKTINFGLVYGMGAKTLAKRIESTVDEAQQYVDKYFSTYPGVKTFWENTEKNIRELGYVKTEFGRIRHRSNEFNAKDNYDQGSEIRSMTNAIIQGSAADMLKIAMGNMFPQLQKIGARIISTIHDEVLVSCPIEYAERAYAIVHRSMMESGKILSVPIKVDIKFGRNWQEAHGEGIKLEEIKNEN